MALDHSLCCHLGRVAGRVQMDRCEIMKLSEMKRERFMLGAL